MSWWQSLPLPGADKKAVKFSLELELVPDVLRAKVVLNSFNMADEHQEG